MRSPNFFGIRSVHMSGGSTTCESPDMTRYALMLASSSLSSISIRASVG